MPAGRYCSVYYVKYLLLYFEENYGLTVEKKIIDAVAVIANENRYHPVCDFLNALQWDGTERNAYASVCTAFSVLIQMITPMKH